MNQSILIDFIIGLPLSNGSTNCIIIIDRLRKGVIFEDLLDIEIKIIIRRFIRYFYRYYRLLEVINHDKIRY